MSVPFSTLILISPDSIVAMWSTFKILPLRLIVRVILISPFQFFSAVNVVLMSAFSVILISIFFYLFHSISFWILFLALLGISFRVCLLFFILKISFVYVICLSASVYITLLPQNSKLFFHITEIFFKMNSAHGNAMPFPHILYSAESL